MKKRTISMLIMVLICLSSCVVQHSAGNSGRVPPGQAKKLSGSKSAKPYAPGQLKK